MTIADVAQHLESIAPLSLQEPYDNAGLITGNPDRECTGILCTLDVTEAVVEEAVSKQCNCIVAHHPLIFKGLKKIVDGYVSETVIAAIRADVAVYAAHTNLDNVPGGVNGKIADRLGLNNRQILDNAGSATGAGLVGNLEQSLAADNFLTLLGQQFETKVIRHTDPPASPILRVAVCGGAGGFLIPKALAAGANAFVTADIRYHEFFEANGRMLLCDIGHYESEQFTTDLFIEVLLRKFPTFAVLKSGTRTNPVRYYTGK